MKQRSGKGKARETSTQSSDPVCLKITKLKGCKNQSVAGVRPPRGESQGLDNGHRGEEEKGQHRNITSLVPGLQDSATSLGHTVV